MLNAQLVKMLRPKTRARTNIGGRKREQEEAKPPSKRTKLPEIESMPTLSETDSPMGTASEISQEYATPTGADTSVDTAATPVSLGVVDLSGPPSPYEGPVLQKQLRWGKAEVKTYEPHRNQHKKPTNQGAASPTSPRAEDPTGTGKGQVPTRIIANALEQPYVYTKHTAAPTGAKVPKVAKAIDKVSKLPTKVAVGTNQESEIEVIVTSWWEDDRDLPHAQNRPEEFCKLGLPEVVLDTETSGEGGVDRYQILRHVRPITGCDLPPEETNKHNLPLQGSPQLKIMDLCETQRYVLLYLRYLGDIIRRALELAEGARVINVEHTQLWTNREGKATQIDLAFKKRPIALFVLFNTNSLVPMHVVEDQWEDPQPPRVIPRIYVWPPYRQPSGTLRSRTVQVSSPRLRGVSVGEAAGIIGDLVTRQGWGGSGVISRIRKGARDETPADNNIREVLFLVTHHQDAAQLLIKDSSLNFGFPTTKGLLPSATEKTALGQREVAIIDYSQQLFLGHRVRIVDAVTERLSELAVQHGVQQRQSEDACLVFEKHLGTPRWAPSDGTVESLLQWKRNSNDTINFYALFTETAYGLLVKAGSSIEVNVYLKLDETTGEKISVPVKVEVGRWSLMGTKSKYKQTTAPPSTHRGQSISEEVRLREAGEAVIHSMQQKTEEYLHKVQQAASAPPVSSSTPETKHLLKNIGHELELLNQKAAAAADANSEGGLARKTPGSANITASTEGGSTQSSQREKIYPKLSGGPPGNLPRKSRRQQDLGTKETRGTHRTGTKDNENLEDTQQRGCQS
ncbi:hypothetical protein CYMTET_28896 [Cymbomonas tetramitiformis]|uniref:Uncharacterized protein n=1 Tax=Cymbomonas tetramitiformis TaxID=36881 RepID=A0AAE0FNJ0_9CHLO|nr:hypothetical protein CYMTET_28896 [Cymbomonas tetramitiformis]